MEARLRSRAVHTEGRGRAAASAKALYHQGAALAAPLGSRAGRAESSKQPVWPWAWLGGTFLAQRYVAKLSPGCRASQEDHQVCLVNKEMPRK